MASVLVVLKPNKNSHEFFWFRTFSTSDNKLKNGSAQKRSYEISAAPSNVDTL